MTGRDAPVAAPGGPRHPGLLEKLIAVIRPEFRADVYLPSPDDPVLGVRPCLVDGCGHPRHCGGHGMCIGHLQRWNTRGRPELDAFIADAGPPLRDVSEPTSCTVAGCRFSAATRGLCDRHRRRWERAGRPDLSGWLAALPAEPPLDRAECGMSFCSRWAESKDAVLCRAHAAAWRRSRFEKVEEYVQDRALRHTAHVDLRELPAGLKLEFQYALQCRHDAQTLTAPPQLVNAAIKWAGRAGARSLLDHDDQQWREITASYTAGNSKRVRAFLIYARKVVDDLIEGTGWDSEYPRDVWRVDRLPGLNAGREVLDGGRRLRFDLIKQPWLRDLAKRWIRLRLVTGFALGTVDANLLAVRRFSEFLTTADDVNGLADVSRLVLERFLAWLTRAPGGPDAHCHLIGGLSSFFAEIRRRGWDPALPTTTVFFAEDYPKQAKKLPRHLAENVMTQVEHAHNLDQWSDPAKRLITVILMQCGLRISDAVRLPFDCLVDDADSAPYLRYYNHKMRREALVPISPELMHEIAEQQRRVSARYADATLLFPRPKGNQDGTRPISGSSYRTALYRWLEICDVRDEHGRPVHLTPHQWRHTLGTRLINRDVPQEVVRKILDHDSPEMTAHYARLHDSTVRRHWEAARKVNVQGETVTLHPDGTVAQASWIKQRLSRATQALPNGYCGLPVVQTCPHANSCLTCPMFITTAEFLPQHRQQRHQTLEIITAAEARGQARLVEMNQQVADNLEKIITSLEADDTHAATEAADAS